MFNHVKGCRLNIRMNYPYPMDEGMKKSVEDSMLLMLNHTELVFRERSWRPGPKDNTALFIDLMEGTYDRLTVIRFIQNMARYTDCEHACAWLYTADNVMVLESVWENELLKIWDVDPDFLNMLPIVDGSVNKFLDALYLHAKTGKDPVIYTAQHIMPKKAVVLARTRSLASEVNRLLAAMDCEEAPKEELVTALARFVKPKWKAEFKPETANETR